MAPHLSAQMSDRVVRTLRCANLRILGGGKNAYRACLMALGAAIGCWLTIRGVLCEKASPAFCFVGYNTRELVDRHQLETKKAALGGFSRITVLFAGGAQGL